MRFCISIHAPHAGRDEPYVISELTANAFQSTRPMRGATTNKAGSAIYAAEFQSTRPMRGATIPP